MLEHFKEAFPHKFEAQLLKLNDINTALGKTAVLVLFFKSELQQSMTLSRLGHMTDRNDSTARVKKLTRQNERHFMKLFATFKLIKKG